MIEVLKKYASGYDLNILAIKNKFEHSLRVMELSEMICNKLELNDNIKYFAKEIALFHDIGRFRQWKLYGTYDDNNSTDHAKLSIAILHEEKILKKITTKVKEQRWITDSISGHNELSVSKVISQNSRILSRILRDANTIDILSNLVNEKSDLNTCEENVSISIQRRFETKALANSNHINNFNDQIIYYLCYLFDITYPCSINYLKDKKIIEELEKKYSNKILDEYFKKILASM